MALVTDADLKRPVFGCVDWGVLVVYILEPMLGDTLQVREIVDAKSL